MPAYYSFRAVPDILAACVVARLPHGRHPAGLRDLTADMKKVAGRNTLTLNVQRTTPNTQVLALGIRARMENALMRKAAAV